MLSYNVQSLVHIVDDAKCYGSLDNILFIPFEYMFGSLKKLVKKPQNPIAQILRQIGEKSFNTIDSLFINSHSNRHRVQHFDGLLIHGYEGYGQFKQYVDDNIFMSNVEGNNCVFINQNTCIVKTFLCLLNQHWCSLHNFNLKKNFFIIYLTPA